MLRRAVVAGRFYTDDPAELDGQLNSFLATRGAEAQEALAVIVPHAGYIYSGAVAGSVYSRVNIPERLILIGPNHTGLGEAAAVMAEGGWETPMGVSSIDAPLASQVLASSSLFTEDERAHRAEHSLEVQLPFIQRINAPASIVPITVMQHGYASCAEMGRALARVIRESESEILLVVSSDMNHYESEAVTMEKDRMAIEKILALDPEGLFNITKEENISMCGAVPATIALSAAIELGATKATLVEHETSGKTSGDYQQVVGYAGIVIN